MSEKKNREVLESISQRNFLTMGSSQIVDVMLKNELAGQRVFYCFLKQQGYDISPEQMDKNQSDGIIGNVIIECKLNEKEGGGPKKAFEELYDIIPNRLKSKGLQLPFYRIYVELESFYVEVYDCHCNLIEKFNWYLDHSKFNKYFTDTKQTYEYDLLDTNVDLVEVIQNIYHAFNIKSKKDAYDKLKDGIVGWFKPFNYEKVDINRLILNNDKMNEKYVQKKEGAFFTPPEYVKISTRFVMRAIEQSKKDGYDDYVIIDRCAGVGNLESNFTKEVYSHLILGTINEAEAITANIRFNGQAEVSVMDALTKEGVDFFKNKIDEYIIKNQVKKLAIIFLENPPYINQSANVGIKLDKDKQKSYIHKIMPSNSGKSELYNQFIWSAWHIYNPYRYVLYAPIKYWKLTHLEPKKIIGGYVCDGKLFNAKQSRGISLIYWSNVDDFNTNVIRLRTMDKKIVNVKKINGGISCFQNDDKNPYMKMTIISPTTFTNSVSNVILTDHTRQDKLNGKISYIGDSNILTQLPLFVSNLYPMKNYTDVDILMKSSDGGNAYTKNVDFLQDCLLYTYISPNNKCSIVNPFWDKCETLLDDKRKSMDIYKIYKEIVSTVKLNGLRNIKDDKRQHDKGKLWKYQHVSPKIEELETKLSEFYETNIIPKLKKYELIK